MNCVEERVDMRDASRYDSEEARRLAQLLGEKKVRSLENDDGV